MPKQDPDSAEEIGSQVQPWKAKKVTRTPEMVAVHWPIAEREIWERFLDICKRDGHSASAEIRAFVALQVKKRSPGNPQRPMEPFFQLPMVVSEEDLWQQYDRAVRRRNWETVDALKLELRRLQRKR